MATTFDNQLLHSVLSGSAPTGKGTTPKVGEFGGEGSQNDPAGENGENPLSPVPPYEEIDTSSSPPPQPSSQQSSPPPQPSSQQSLQQPQPSSQPPSQSAVELEVRPVVQAEGADGLISVDERANNPTKSAETSRSKPPAQVAAFNPDSFRAINDPSPITDSKDSPLPGPTEINRTAKSGSTDSKSPSIPKNIAAASPKPIVLQPNGAPIVLHNTIPLYALQRDPAPVDCPRCRTRNITKISHKNSTATHAWAATAAVTTLGLALAVPYFVKGTKNVTHSCPNCKAKLATCMHSGRTEIHCHA